MAYIGTKPTIGNFQICDAISVVNGQAAYTMQVGSVNVIPQSANHMIVSLNGVIQKPGSSFTVSGSTITFASNLATGDAIDFIQILGDVLDLGTPSDATVTAAKIGANAVTAAKLNNDIISGSTELASAPADTDEFLVSDAGTLKRVDYSYLKAVNTPTFHVYRSGNQSISNNTTTKVQFNAETFDTANAFDSSTNFRFTPQTSGKYYFYAGIYIANGSSASLEEYQIQIQKNGSAKLINTIDRRTSGIGYNISVPVSGLLEANGSSDYFEVHANVVWGGGSQNIIGAVNQTYFGGYKIIE